MSVGDLNALEAQGMEIGAHTVLHRDLPDISSDEAMRELCLSRNWLMDRGFDVYDMAYPHDVTNANVKQLAEACGYNSARTGSQLQCDANHACAETIPPLDAYSLRTPNDFKVTTTLAQMKAAVTNAQNNGGGWVPLELHDVCDGPGDPLLPAGAKCTAPYYVTRALYAQFLDWLEGEVDAGRVQVKTVHDVVGGPLEPQVAIEPAPVRTGNMLVNPSFEQAGGHGHPAACWSNITNGPGTPPGITSTSDAHEGSHALAISVPGGYESWAYNLIAPELDLAQCAPAAIPGHHYTFGGWYKGNGPIKVVAYWRNADNGWARLSWGAAGTATFPASTPWRHATFTFQAPAGATAVSAGFYVDGGSAHHSYKIDDTSLVDDSFALGVTRAGTGTGTVASNPAGIACGSTCQAQYLNGATVTLTASAAAGSSFTGWSGACAGAATACSVSMSAARSVTATFTAIPAPPLPSPDPPAPSPDAPAPSAPAAVPAAPVQAPVALARAAAPTAVKLRPALRVRPQVSGRARVGSRLVCSRGSWNGSPTGYVFTWRRGGKVVGNGSRYVVKKADRGHALRCDVMARNAKGTTTVASLVRRVAR